MVLWVSTAINLKFSNNQFNENSNQIGYDLIFSCLF
jgi:hypothetical protein